jgi:hypothetical protein
MENNPTQADLVSEIKTLNDTLKKQHTIGHLLRDGMLRGIGFVIGTTILAGAIISALVFLFEDVPLVGPVVEQVESLTN